MVKLQDFATYDNNTYIDTMSGNGMFGPHNRLHVWLLDVVVLTLGNTMFLTNITGNILGMLKLINSESEMTHLIWMLFLPLYPLCILD